MTKTVRKAAVAAVLALIAGCVGMLINSGTANADIPVYSHPALQVARVIHTNPFPGTAIKPRDAEGLAYVPQDGSIWLADDNLHQLYEIDVATGALKRLLPGSDLSATKRLGGTDVAGDNTASDFEAMGYDAANDILYVFAGKCCESSIRAAAFRLIRDANGAFQVDSFQPFTAPMNDFSGMGVVNGQIWAGYGKDVYPYNYATNSFGSPLTLTGVSGKVTGMGFSPNGQDLWVTNNTSMVFRVNWATRAAVPNHTFDMADFGIPDARAVEVVGNQLFICDGYDFFSSGSPDRYAITVFDVVNQDGTPAAPTASFTPSTAQGPAPLSVQFTDTSTGGPTQWSWNFGDGATSAQQSPAHTFAAGSYPVTLTATNATGSTSSTQTITATSSTPVAPTAAFTATPAQGPAPLAVQFADTSTGGPTAWSWDFGDGATSAQQSPSHTFAVGTYTVSLTATNAQGSTSVSHAVSAATPPDSGTFAPVKDSFVNSGSPTKNYGTDYDYLRLLAGSSEYRSYVSFDVNGLSGTPTSAVLRLFVTDASESGGAWQSVGSTWTETGLTWNNAPPMTGPVLADVGPVTAGTWVDIDVTSAVTGSGSFSFAARTTSTNSLRYASKETTTPPQLVVTVGPSTPVAPTAAFTASPPQGTAPLAVQFTDTSTGVPIAWWWEFGDGSTSPEQSPSHTFAAGAHTVTLTATNAEGATSVTHTVTADPPITNGTFGPVKDAFVNSGSPTKNYGTDYDYLRLLAGSSEYRSYLSFDVSGFAGRPTSAVLRLFVTDASDRGGIWQSVGTTWTEAGLTWNNAPALTGPVLADVGTVNAGTWVDIDVTSAVTGNGTFSFGARTTSTNSLRYASKESTTPPQLIVALQPPVAAFTTSSAQGPAPLAVQFTDTSTGGPTAWSWDFGDGTTSAAPSPSHTFAVGAYTVSLTATNAEGSTSTSHNVTAETPPSTFGPVKDTFVNSGSATKNYGTDYDYLRLLAGSSEYRSYVSFTVSGLSGTPARAVLRLFVTDASDRGGIWQSVGSTWTETGLTWNNAPALTGPVLADVGTVTAGTWVDIDVTSAVTGNGTISFGARTTSTNSLRYASRETTTPPQLVVTP